MTLALLLHCEGENDSTTLIDDSPSPKTVTAFGNAKLSNSKRKIGSTSVVLDGSDSSIMVTSHADLNFDSANFTVECWVYRSVYTDSSVLFSKRNTPTYLGGYTEIFVYFANQYPSFYIGQDGGGWAISNLISSIQAPMTTWTHIALVRNGNVFTLYVNGVSGCSQSAGVTLFSNSAAFTIGGDFVGSGNTYLNGYVDQIRIVKGQALYTGTFTPPLRPFNNYDLLLQFDGSNGSTTLVDSSYIPKTVTAFGNAQHSTHQYIHGISSLFLDGTGDYVHISDHPDLNFGAENFTLEFWMFPNTVSTTQVLINKRTVAAYCEIYFFLTNDIPTLYVSSDASSWVISALQSSIPVLVSKWTHLAVVRNGSNFTIYVNGVSGASSTFAGTLLTNTEPLVIGNDYSGSPFVNFNGYIKDVRVIKGKALYTTTFTPPSAIPNEYSLLLNFEGTNGSTTIVDESSSSKTLTAYGGAIISTTQFRKGTSSLYVNGTDSYLRSPPSSDFSFGSGNFTIEGWYNSSLAGSEYGSLCGVWGASSYRSWNIYIGGPDYSGGQLWFYWSTNGSSYSNLTFTTPHQANVWKHFAFVRSGNFISLYINGIIVGSPQAFSDTFYNSTQQDLTIGASEITGGEYFKGYIDQLKIVKGKALYVKNFFIEDDVTNYSLLLNFEGTNGSTSIVDESPSPKTMTAQGNAQLSTSQVKYGSTSLALDGTGDYVTTPTSSDLQFGTSDFTIESWVYPLSFASAPNLFSQRDGSSGVTIRLQNSGVLVFFGAGTNTLSQSGPLINLNEWTHISLVRNGATFNSYINGVFSGTNNIGTGYSLSFGDPTFIGGASGYSEYLNGYVDQLKIVKGVAKYNYTFSLVDPIPPLAYFYDTFNDYLSTFISYYSLAEASGTSISDRTSSYNLTLSSGTVSYQDVSLASDYDYSMTFSGQSVSGSFINLNGFKELSIGFAVKTSVESQSVISKSGVFSIEIDSSGFILWEVNSETLQGTLSVSDDVSHYVICSYREGGLALYIDGINNGYQLPHGQTITDAGTQNLIIGTFTGTLDEIFFLSSFVNLPSSYFYYGLANELSLSQDSITFNSWFFDEGAPPGNYLDYCFFDKSSKNVLDCEYSADIITTNPIIYTRATFVPINGFVTVEGLPSSRQVFLLEWHNKRIVRMTWSDPSTGYYEFTDVKAGYYFIWCPDHLESFRPISSLRISNFS
jgi:hypothetical protein